MIQAVVVGASSGGMEAIKQVLSALPRNFDVPVVVVLHIGANDISHYLLMLETVTNFLVKEAEEKEVIKPSTVYFAPPNYHLQIETNLTFSLSVDPKINFSRPSIDVLFETAAWTFKENLIGVLLTGSNRDGAAGLRIIKENGGTVLVENPASAFSGTMPHAAIKECTPDYVLELKDMAQKIFELCTGK